MGQSPRPGAPTPSAPPSPVPPEVAVELDRIVRRWHQLPIDRVLSVAPGTTSTYAERVRALVQRLADQQLPPPPASASGAGGVPVPDLGPATLVDQLRVVVHDACTSAAVPAARLTDELAALRRELP